MDQNGYMWAVTSMDCLSQAEGQTNVVFRVTYNCSKSVQDGYFTAVKTGKLNVEYKQSDPYTPFNELTESQVLDWVFLSLGTDEVAQITADVDAQISAYMAPAVVTPPLPWATESAGAQE
jgi:hypothetical protein